ncbi:MAG: hypothetical protein Q9218_004042, partial [Villophora microphyllina]
MAWQPPPYFFAAIAGSIVGIILTLGFLGALINYMRNRAVEKDLEARQALPERGFDILPPAGEEMAQRTQRNDGEDRMNGESDGMSGTTLVTPEMHLREAQRVRGLGRVDERSGTENEQGFEDVDLGERPVVNSASRSVFGRV